MTIDIICVGKIKEKFYRDAIDEYIKRLSKFAKINIFEVKDEKTFENPSDKEMSIILDNEGKRMLKYISESAYLISLCIEGNQIDSVELSSKIKDIELKGKSHIQFIIGGSLGISDEIKKMSSYKLSFSKMTFPHQLMRVILLEQVYRAYKIANNEPYHK